MFYRLRDVTERLKKTYTWGMDNTLACPLDTPTIIYGTVTLVGSFAFAYWLVHTDYVSNMIGNFIIERYSWQPIKGYWTGFYSNPNLWQTCQLRRTIGEDRLYNMKYNGDIDRHLLEFYDEYVALVFAFKHNNPISIEVFLMCAPIHWNAPPFL